MKAKKSVRIIKKVRAEKGGWRFVSLKRSGERYFWDARPGVCFLEWWEGSKRRREAVGDAPSQALEAQRRKSYELVGQMVALKTLQKPNGCDLAEGTCIDEAVEWFLSHVGVHSPDKPRTLARYRSVVNHFQQVLGRVVFVEAIERRHIDEYKAARSRENDAGRSGGPVQPSTINFEVSVL